MIFLLIFASIHSIRYFWFWHWFFHCSCAEPTTIRKCQLENTYLENRQFTNIN